MAWIGQRRLHKLGGQYPQMIRIDAAWLAAAPMDMRGGTDTALARVVDVFGAAQPHTAYIFANKRANRLKILVHDGFGIWLARTPAASRQVHLGLRRDPHGKPAARSTGRAGAGFAMAAAGSARCDLHGVNRRSGGPRFATGRYANVQADLALAHYGSWWWSRNPCPN
jgi:hypothetical protein